MSGDQPNTVPTIKVDQPMNDDTLNSIMMNYNNDNYEAVNSITVRPWLFEDYGRKPYIDDLSQYALYKCMHEICNFFTNSADNFQAHMTTHCEIIDHYEKNKVLSKMRRDKLIKFRECPYCSSQAKTDYHMIRYVVVF